RYRYKTRRYPMLLPLPIDGIVAVCRALRTVRDINQKPHGMGHFAGSVDCKNTGHIECQLFEKIIVALLHQFPFYTEIQQVFAVVSKLECLDVMRLAVYGE